MILYPKYTFKPSYYCGWRFSKEPVLFPLRNSNSVVQLDTILSKW
jgi:hypothetical protein